MPTQNIRKQHTYRVFLSSTFSDFRQERNYLQESVFPSLEKFCADHGARFQAVDLRWGISNEASYDHKTLDICLSEIKQCKKISPRPSFVMLVGDRYGWRPLPNRIPAHVFEGLRPTPLLREWYIIDKNDGEGHYLLKPRIGQTRDATVWAGIEDRLRSEYEQCLTAVKQKDGDRSLLAATDQEIRLGFRDTVNNLNHVYCFLRNLNNIPSTADALDFVDGRLQAGQLIRDPRSEKQLLAMKALIRSKLNRRNIFEFHTDFDRRQEMVSPLCEAIYQALLSSIQAEMERIASVDAYEEARQAEAAFGLSVSTPFVGQEKLLATLKKHLQGGTGCAIIHGESGKSAVCAMLGKQLGGKVIVRHIGRSILSADADSLAGGLMRELGVADGGTLDQQMESIARRLKNSGQILILDGLDKLPQAARLLRPFQNNNRVLVACQTPLLAQALCVQAVFPIPPLTPSDREALLSRILEQRNRSLQDEQQSLFRLRLKENPSPPYCRLAAEQAALLHSDDTARLAPNLEGIVQEIVTDLTKKHNHEPVLVRHMLALIGSARNGITYSALSAMILEDREVFTEFSKSIRHPLSKPQLPIVIWSRLFYDLAPYLISSWRFGEEVLSFAYDCFQSYSLTHCVFPELVGLARAVYQPDDRNASSITMQGLSELPHLLLSHCDPLEYVRLACQPPYLQRKLENNLGYELWEELKMAISMGSKEAGVLSRFLAANIDAMTDRPALTANLLYAEIRRAAAHGLPGTESLLSMLITPSFQALASDDGKVDLLPVNEFGRESSSWWYLSFSPDGQSLLAMEARGRFSLCSLKHGMMDTSDNPLVLNAPYKYGAVESPSHLYAQSDTALSHLTAPDFFENGFRFSSWETVPTPHVKLEALSEGNPTISAQYQPNTFALELVTYRPDNTCKHTSVAFMPSSPTVNHIALRDHDGHNALALTSGGITATTGLYADGSQAMSLMSCVFYNNGNKVAGCTSDGRLMFYDAYDSFLGSKEIAVPGKLEQSCECLVYDPAGNQLLIGHRNGYLTIYNIATEETKRIFSGMRGGILCMAVSADGKLVAVGGRGSSMARLRVFRMDDLVQTAANRMRFFTRQPCGDYSVAGRFVCGCFLFQAEYRERKTNQRQVLCIFDGPNAYDSPLPLHSASCFDACGASGEVAVGLADTVFRFLSAAQPQSRAAIFQAEGPITAVCYTREGDNIAVASHTHVTVLQASNGKWEPGTTIVLRDEAGKTPAPIAFNGRLLAVVTEPETISVNMNPGAKSMSDIYKTPSYTLRVYDAETGREHWKLSYRGYMTGLYLLPDGLLYTLGTRMLNTPYQGQTYTRQHHADTGVYRWHAGTNKTEQLLDIPVLCGCCAQKNTLFFAGGAMGEIACIPLDSQAGIDWLKIPAVPCAMRYDEETHILTVMDNGEPTEGLPRLYRFQNNTKGK